MSDSPQPIYLFEHPSFGDVQDALRQSRLYGFKYRTDHAKYKDLCEALKRRVPAKLLDEALTKPLESVPDNSALYILNLTPLGREELWPTLLAEALSLGFCAFDDQLGQCHTPAGVWTADGFRTSSSP